MKSIKYILSSALMMAACTLTLSSCSDDDLGPTIFPDPGSELDSTAYTYKFDKWLQQNYLKPYNLQFVYKMKDISTNMNYNVIPASFQKAEDVAVLAKYMWFDAYEAVAGDGIEFLKQNSPRMIHIIGSPAYETDGSIIQGLAEGGVKISLYQVNDIDANSYESLNNICFKVMHHEFTHILHQKKTYPTTFNLVSNGKYDGTNWASKNTYVVRSLGFVDPYASSQYREDYAETTALYITYSDEEWAQLLDDASHGWYYDSNSSRAYRYCYYTNNEVSDDNIKYASTSEVRDYVTPDDDTVKVAYNTINNSVRYSNNYYMGTAPYTINSDSTAYHDAKGRPVDAGGYLLDLDGSRIRIPLLIHDVEDTDGVKGNEAILAKLAIIRQWFLDSWNIDLDALHREVQKRQHNYDINALRKQIDDVK